MERFLATPRPQDNTSSPRPTALSAPAVTFLVMLPAMAIITAMATASGSTRATPTATVAAALVSTSPPGTLAATAMVRPLSADAPVSLLRRQADELIGAFAHDFLLSSRTGRFHWCAVPVFCITRATRVSFRALRRLDTPCIQIPRATARTGWTLTAGAKPWPPSSCFPHAARVAPVLLPGST